MAQRVRMPYRGSRNPSSAIQLPILAALHAGLPTLFKSYHTRFFPKSKYPFCLIPVFSSGVVLSWVFRIRRTYNGA